MAGATIERELGCEPLSAARGGAGDRRDADDAVARSLPAPALLVLVALTAGVVAQGAYYPDGQRVMVAVLGAALVTGWWSNGWSAADARLAPVRAAGILAAWAVLSAIVAGDAAAAGSTVALLAGIVTVLLVCRHTTPAQRDSLVGAMVAVGVVAAVTGWVGVAWRATPWALEDGGLWRAATVLTYANATAGLLVPVTLVAWARLSRHRRSPVPVACTCLLLVGVGSTLSRAGLLALLLGAAVLAVLGRAVWRSRAGPSSPEIWAGAVAGLVALPVHSAFDFLWHIPVIPLVGGLLVGVTLHQRAEPTHES